MPRACKNVLRVNDNLSETNIYFVFTRLHNFHSFCNCTTDAALTFALCLQRTQLIFQNLSSKNLVQASLLRRHLVVHVLQFFACKKFCPIIERRCLRRRLSFSFVYTLQFSLLVKFNMADLRGHAARMGKSGNMIGQIRDEVRILFQRYIQ